MTDHPDASDEFPEITKPEGIVGEEARSASPNNDVSQESVDVVPRQRRPRPALLREGPGLRESLGWVLGFFALQLVFGIFFLVLYLASLFLTNPELFQAVADSEELKDKLAGESQTFVMAAAQASLIVCCLAMTRIRWGKSWTTSLRFNGFRPIHILAVAALIMPTQVLSQAVYEQANYYWQMLAGELPALSVLDKFNIVESAPDLIKNSPLAISILIFAIAPALNEEIIFRGVVGNGLMNRYGVVFSMLVASTLFAIVHMHPVHAAAVFGLGAVIHWTYITTRTIWAPILLHFLNNGFALFSTLYLGAGDSHDDASISPLLTACSLVTVGVLCLFFWKSRRYLVNEEGEKVPVNEEWKTQPADLAKFEVRQDKPSVPVSLITLCITLVTLYLIFKDTAS
ncbi:CAAX amino terminal protease self- immunity [Polystyrenella longa]|uniref:CAAX amino terminal protease self-immunity n=1 Tax=Polystyrenella longa TaxID=2528007 RepID=A0A518CNL0_9PLAN|nr:CPBP family intramembrane glutamic endopeptidase [Polystyrenella longa]QDU80812.1 CAAX amino terminal protease self- immunity [Polystyrenella longa]